MKKTFIKAVEIRDGVTVRYRTEEDKVIIENFKLQNYFYISEEDYEKYGRLVVKYCSNYGRVIASNGIFMKLYLKDNFKRNNCKKVLEDKGVVTYEADITAPKRYLLDNADDYDFSNYKTCHLDFESDDRNPRGRDFKGGLIFGEEQITSCAIINEAGETVFFRNENADNHIDAKEEANVIKEVLKYLSDYDIVTAFAGNWFDFEFLKHRIKQHKEMYDRDLDKNFNLKLINKIDFKELYKKYIYWAKHDKFSLNGIAMDTLSEGKVDWSEDVPDGGMGRYYEFYKNHPVKFKEYNIQDVMIMKLLDEKFNLMTIHKIITNKMKTTPEEAMFTSHILDNFIIREEHKQNKICDSKPTKDEIEKRKKINIGGGHIESFRGMYDNVLVYDFKSHYPLIVATWNISPETLVGTYPVDLEEVKEFFNEKEFEFLNIVKDKSMLKKELKSWMNENKVDGLKVAMKFNRVYQGIPANKYANKKDYLITPADLNHSKVGWFLHEHRLFKNPKDNSDVGNLVKYMGGAVEERDKVKYIQIDKRKEDKNFEGSEEDVQLSAESNSLKILGNSAYGGMGFRSTRFFEYNIADTITTTARWLIKKAINEAEDNGFKLANTHTDSIYIYKEQSKVDVDKTNKLFYDLYKKLFKDFKSNREFKLLNPETKQMEKSNYWTVFEFENKIESIITSAKARYYYLDDGKVKTQGGAFKKNDTNPLAKIMQKELVSDFLNKRFDLENWIKKLTDLKELVFSNNLQEEYLIMRKQYNKHHDEFGKPMIDKVTGNQKQNKDGKLRFSNVPTHIKLVKRLEAETKGYEFPLGDTIKYIIGDPKLIDIKAVSRKKIDKEKFNEVYKNLIQYGFGVVKAELNLLNIKYKEVKESTQEAISVEECRSGKLYDKEHYWGMIMKPLVEIFSIVRAETYFLEFGELIGFTERKIKRLKEELIKDIENE